MIPETLTLTSNIVGLIMGGITLLTLIINFVRFHLPSKKIKVLESLLDETETTFSKAVEDGLLIEPGFVQETEKHITLLKIRVCSLQSRAYHATTLSKDYAEFFRGTSLAIGGACQSVKRLRAVVISASEERRRRLLEMNSARCSPQLQLVQSVPPLNSEPTLPPIVDTIPCPCSCSTTTLSEAQSVASLHNPFSEYPETDSDVSTADVSNDTSAVHTSANLEVNVEA